jgi:integrase
VTRKYPGVKRLRDGRYYIRVKARDPKTGKMIDLRDTIAADSIREAVAKREELRQSVELRGDEMHTRVRLVDAVSSWLGAKLPSLKASTRRTYADVLDLHVLPALGDYWLDKIAPQDVIDLRDKWLTEGAAPATVNTRLRVLRQVLADITHERGIRNPSARVPGVRVPKRREPKGLEAHELRAVLESLQTDSPQWYPIALTLALTGARWGEVAALEWRHVDEEDGIILFEQAHVRGEVDETKTGIVKECPLVPELAQILKEHRRALLAEQVPGLGEGWVFPSRTGGLMQPSSLRKPLARACKAAEVRTISPHGLRYTFNHLAKRVASADVARSITGHVTDEMTRHYDWIGADEKLAAVEGVLSLVRRSGTSAAGGRSGGNSTEDEETAD